MTFHNPHLLWLLTLLLPAAGYYLYRLRKGGAALRISSVAGVLKAPRTVRYYLRHAPFVLRMAALATLVVALARPQSAEQNTRTNTDGIDIMLALDVSGSMLARDFRPDRLEAAKEVAGSFISDRYGDRIGLVVFAGEAFTQSPLTADQSTLLTLLGRVRSGLIEDGTAIGNGLATAINRLRESDAKSKVIILLTDVATGHAFIILCGILYCVDFIVSTLAALQLGEKLEGLQTAMEEFTEYLQTTKVYSSTEEARELFGNYKKHLPTKKEFQEKLGEYQRRIAGKIEEKGLSEYAEGIRSRSKGFREQYQERVSRITGVNKRFMKAYPTIHKVSRKKKGNQKETK